ncbi:MAG: HEAT repeat domain-containing protein [Deltaproteobacteria bacterium]|uniref:HEAT repeat domain-containing protein n=1 Tax=Candidatus Zymogenus saltonus TaxID=2844893 RepID=A0A9D8KDV4_9DELT|nr:HEAT repeat domain-containing protein [Candidatus Zymogenus saltonus]
MERENPNGYNYSDPGGTTGGGDHDKYLKGPAPIITVEDSRVRNRIAIVLIIVITALAAFLLFTDKVPIYIKMLKIDIPEVKAFAAAELGKSKDKRAVWPLVNTLTGSMEQAVWEASVSALLKIGSVCPDGSPRGEGCPAGDGGKGNVSNAKLIGESLKIFSGETYDDRYRDRLSAFIALGLKDKNVDVRIFAAQLLSNFGRENAVKSLTDALNDDDPRVRAIAKLSLDSIKDRIAKPMPDTPYNEDVAKVPSHLETTPEVPEPGSPPALSPSKSFTDLESEFKELGKTLTPPFEFEAMVKDLKSGDPKVRAKAAMTLAYLKQRRGTVYILPLLKNPEESVRIRAEFSLGELNNFASVRPLIETYKTAGEEEKLVIFHSLLKMDDTAVKRALSEVSAGEDKEGAKIAAIVLHFGKKEVE